MKSITRLSLAAACATLLTTVTTTSRAFEYVEVGVGLIGQAGAVFLDKPGDQSLAVAGERIDVNPEYPGFAGASGGIGGMVEARFMKYVGIEFDIIHQWDFGTAELKITNLGSNNTTRFDVEIGNTALHMPLLLKGVIPGKVASPLLFVGPEFVVPVGDGTAEIQNQTGSVPITTAYSALSESYINVMFGLGMEIILPIESEAISIRIPLTLRGTINPGVSGKREERASHITTGSGNNADLQSVEYKTDWKYSAAANLGVAAYF